MPNKGNFWLLDYAQNQFGPRFDTLPALVEWSKKNADTSLDSYEVIDKEQEMQVELDLVVKAYDEGECPNDLSFF